MVGTISASDWLPRIGDEQRARANDERNARLVLRGDPLVGGELAWRQRGSKSHAVTCHHSRRLRRNGNLVRALVGWVEEHEQSPTDCQRTRCAAKDSRSCF